jgi:hypothetical protein
MHPPINVQYSVPEHRVRDYDRDRLTRTLEPQEGKKKISQLMDDEVHRRVGGVGLTIYKAENSGV